MPQYRTRLTTKQSIFVKEYIANNYNATKAVQSAYDTHSYGAARVIGSKLLTNANVRRAIQAEFTKYGIPVDAVVEKHKELLNSKDGKIVLQAIKLFYKAIL